MERFHTLGLAMMSFSSLLAVWSFLVLGSIPLTALGIGLTILGISIFMTPVHPIPSQTIRTLLEGSVLSIEAVLEELNISKRGYYVMGGDGRVYLYVPLDDDSPPSKGMYEVKGLVSTEGGKRYLTLIPPAAEVIKSGEVAEMGFDSALKYVLVDLTELADGVDVSLGDLVAVRVSSPKARIGAGRFKSVFGSLEACIAACVAANLIGVTKVVDELEGEDYRVIYLEVQGF